MDIKCKILNTRVLEVQKKYALKRRESLQENTNIKKSRQFNEDNPTRLTNMFDDYLEAIDENISQNSLDKQ